MGDKWVENAQVLPQNISLFCENGEGISAIISRFPSLDTHLRWIPEDFEETGDDLVNVVLAAQTTHKKLLGFIKMHMLENQ